MVKVACPPDGIVLDPFMGSGTTAVAAKRWGRNFVGFELNPEYCEIVASRLASPEASMATQNNQPTEPIRTKSSKIQKEKKKQKSGEVIRVASQRAA